jgi:hypothetical protein
MDVYLAVPDPNTLGLGEDDGEGVVANKWRDANKGIFYQLHMPLVWRAKDGQALIETRSRIMLAVLAIANRNRTYLWAPYWCSRWMTSLLVRALAAMVGMRDEFV